jgi:hypothetical protein
VNPAPTVHGIILNDQPGRTHASVTATALAKGDGVSKIIDAARTTANGPIFIPPAGTAGPGRRDRDVVDTV